ncbi:MAG: glycosyltransferase [Oscillospiraceae bacterium]|nr:glycosyltransferase [Oscillospiraceae bacterium]
MSISTVLLAYQEAENLKILIPKIKKQLDRIGEDYEIVVVDTEQKTDDTDKVCEEYQVKYVNQKYPGFGGAFRTGIEYAQMELFLILDSDGSHDPEYIPQLYQTFRSGADLVIGSRYVKGGKTNDSILSVVMSKMLNTVFRLMLGIRAADISTDYRLYRTQQLKNISLQCENYDVLQEVLLQLKLQKPDFCIKEVPITFQKRIYGESKRQLLRFVISYIKTLFRLIRIKISVKAGKS